jgi:hypothetical protein
MRSIWLAVAALPLIAAASPVEVIRTPAGGVQPQAAVDPNGAIHLIYYQGEPAAGDLYYVRRAAGERTFSAPIRVNSVAASAIAAGSIRGAQIALGRNGRVHVAWNGSQRAEPKGPEGAVPMLYTRLNDAGDAFEPQRNLIRRAPGLDGGGALAADARGNVYVFWHAPEPGKDGEEYRRVWVAHSPNDGASFEPERAAWDEPTGACGCCGMRALVGRDGSLYVLYRAATRLEDRDMVLLVSRDRGRTFQGTRVHPWKLKACPMSSASIAPVEGGALLAWETEKQVWFARYDARRGQLGQVSAAPGQGSRKHPSLAVNGDGSTLLAWAEGTSHRRGGTLAWQILDAAGHPSSQKGAASDFPAYSLPQSLVLPGGRFLLIY